MYCDLPILRRCCFCLPLRPGLIAWCYIKMAILLVFMFLLSVTLYDNLTYYYRGFWLATATIVIQFSLLIAMFVDIIFTGIFLASAHRKNAAQMKKCLYYHIVMFVVTNVCFAMFTAYVAYIVYLWRFLFGELLVFVLAAGFLNAVIQFYLILLVRSEVYKLSNDCFFRFENHAASPNCVVTIGNLNGTKKQDKVDLIKEEVPPSIS